MSNVLPLRSTVSPPVDQLACVPDGVYELEYIDFYTGIIHGGPKVAVWFRIVTMGEYFHVPLARYYHVQRIAKNKAFTAGWHSDLIREFTKVLGVRPQRKDRVPLTKYHGFYILGRVYTVGKDSKQRKLPEPSHYSVIGELLKIKQ